MSLETCRDEINGIDKQLAELFLRRMQVVEEVAKEKINNGIPVLDPGREKKVVASVMEGAPERSSGYLRDFINHVMDLSKSRQREMMRAAGLSDANPFLQLLAQTGTEIKTPRVAVQGVNGSYASHAARAMYLDGGIRFVERWEDAFWEVAGGHADYGVLPLENTTAGLVPEVYDLLLRHNLYIVKSVDIPISHCLLGVRGASLNEVTAVYSHPHAFPQCANFLAKHPGLHKVPCLNTAVAAQQVALEGSPHKAALAGADCAHLYGLDILCRGVEDKSGNCTRFISVARRPELNEDADKISIIFTLPHVTGSLYRLLGRFALSGLNISKIESRPNPDKSFEYYFYLDFLGGVQNRHIVDLLASLSEELPGFYYLGNYSETKSKHGDQ